MHYYDLLGDDDIQMDGVDNMLDCIRLKWERLGEENEGHAKGKVFAIFLLDSVHGRVHVIVAKPLVKLLHGTVPYKAAV